MSSLVKTFAALLLFTLIIGLDGLTLRLRGRPGSRAAGHPGYGHSWLPPAYGSWGYGRAFQPAVSRVLGIAELPEWLEMLQKSRRSSTAAEGKRVMEVHQLSGGSAPDAAPELRNHGAPEEHHGVLEPSHHAIGVTSTTQIVPVTVTTPYPLASTLPPPINQLGKTPSASHERKSPPPTHGVPGLGSSTQHDSSASHPQSSPRNVLERIANMGSEENRRPLPNIGFGNAQVDTLPKSRNTHTPSKGYLPPSSRSVPPAVLLEHDKPVAPPVAQLPSQTAVYGPKPDPFAISAGPADIPPPGPTAGPDADQFELVQKVISGFQKPRQVSTVSAGPRRHSAASGKSSVPRHPDGNGGRYLHSDQSRRGVGQPHRPTQHVKDVLLDVAGLGHFGDGGKFGSLEQHVRPAHNVQFADNNSGVSSFRSDNRNRNFAQPREEFAPVGPIMDGTGVPLSPVPFDLQVDPMRSLSLPSKTPRNDVHSPTAAPELKENLSDLLNVAEAEVSASAPNRPLPFPLDPREDPNFDSYAFYSSNLDHLYAADEKVPLDALRPFVVNDRSPARENFAGSQVSSQTGVAHIGNSAAGAGRPSKEEEQLVFSDPRDHPDFDSYAFYSDLDHLYAPEGSIPVETLRKFITLPSPVRDSSAISSDIALQLPRSP